MPRKKRSEKQPEGAVRPAVAPAIAPPRVSERMVAAICPCCGKTIPRERATKIGYVTIAHTPYFESINWDENKPFGVSFVAGGRGSLRDWHYINPDDAPELFEAVKARLIQAVREWIAKGWITEEEVALVK